MYMCVCMRQRHAPETIATLKHTLNSSSLESWSCDSHSNGLMDCCVAWGPMIK